VFPFKSEIHIPLAISFTAIPAELGPHYSP
jgi:hypothetical protein